MSAAPGSSPNRRRRRLLIGAGLVGGAFALGVWGLVRPRDRLAPPDAFRPEDGSHRLTAWLRIGTDGTITVQVPYQEMGQGITTALPMLVAEEMDADWASVRFESAPIDPVYANATVVGDGVPLRPDDHGWPARLMRHGQWRFGQLLGVQATGGSTGLRDAWVPVRLAGATARSMLVHAAAGRFGVPPGECTTADGAVHHPPSGRRASYAELAAIASALPIPRDVTPRARADFRLLGKPRPRLDIPAKVDGSAVFSSDIRLPGQLYAAIVQCPVIGGALRSVEAGQARAQPGVKAVVELPATSTSSAAVAVVAERFWQARTASDLLDITWEPGPAGAYSSEAEQARQKTALAGPEARVYDEAGEVEHGLAAPTRLLDLSYHVPYLAHAAMEPMACTARIDADGGCEVWVGSQSPTLVRWYAAKAAGIDSERVQVHTPFLGGGFGRRAEMDVVMQTVAIARQVPGRPVQLLWTREEDMRHDVYRPMASARMQAALDAGGRITAWSARVASQSCTYSFTSRLLPAAASTLMKDKTTLEGLFDLPYALPDRRSEHVLMREPVPVGFWRSVGHSHNAFFAECFMDECAQAAGRDPFEFRRSLLSHAPRHKAVLEAAAARAGWGGALPEGQGRGIALAESFHSIVAQVAEVEVRDSQLAVRRIVCVVDCGFAVNPDAVAAQMEGSIVFGLTAALGGAITLKDGRVEQGNFGDYPLLRLADTPEIEVHIIESGIEHLGGVGEPGTPPVAPAVCNAIHAATGKRIRSLPIVL
jgi:isoquinoline 1-oxidoreductase beta subunit